VDRLDEARAGDGVLVIGTAPFVGEGFDAPVLDTLSSSLRRSRSTVCWCNVPVASCAPRPVRNVVEAHDYHDSAVPLVASSLRRRMPGYRALGFIQKA
jgi:hypothetical protein